MELKNQVCSLELAQKLKELGVKQESLFYWQEYQDQEIRCVMGRHEHFNGTETSAYTVAELGELLKIATNHANPNFTAGMPEWNERLQKWEYELPKGAWISEDTEANARASLAVFSAENNLLTPSV